MESASAKRIDRNSTQLIEKNNLTILPSLKNPNNRKSVDHV